MSPKEFKALRLKYGPSQREFGEKIDLTQSWVGSLERGIYPINKKTIDSIEMLKSGQTVIVENHTKPKLEIIQKSKNPILIKYKGFEIVIHGSLKDVVKQLKNIKGES